MKIAVITGSRDWTFSCHIRVVLLGTDMVAHGGARGADDIADKLASKMQIDTMIFRARWDTSGFGAGPERNERMAVWAEKMMGEGHDVRCFAFPLKDSVGTWDCVERMRARGIYPRIWDNDGDIQRTRAEAWLR